MKARQLTRQKEFRDDGTFLEIVIWELPAPLLPCRHRYKYRLAYVVNSVRVVGYDNERGKGDHRHRGGRGEVYEFVSLEKLLDDFRSDVEGWK